MNDSGGNGRCFVISPIGKEGSPERERADIVLHSIIEPALAKCNLRPVRSDQIDEPGLISTEMYKRILGDEMCIVVLTDFNPNVFYELAIAHAAARPVVLLIEKDKLPPFDIKDHRCVEYDASDASTSQKAVDAVVKHVTALVQSTESPKVPFDTALSPLGATVGWRMAGRTEQAALRRVLGKDALGEQGVTVTVPVYEPLVRDNFQGAAQVTMARKTDESGDKVQRPIYGDVLHFDDYRAAQEIMELLGELGARNVNLQRDADFLGHWAESPCVICLGSPFVNAALGELGTLSADVNGAWITGNRTTMTLDTYRVVIEKPQRLVLRVDQTHALGVIVRLPNPSSPENSVIGLWGCRAESTYATARFFHRSFMTFAGGDQAPAAVMLLAVRGPKLNNADPMYVATDGVVVNHNEDLLRWYICPETGQTSAAKVT